MNASDLPAVPTTTQRIDAAFRAILAGRFDAPEVLDILWGCTHVDSETYWRLRRERAIEMGCAAAQVEIRDMLRRARGAINRKLDDLAAAVAAARMVA